MGVPGVFTGRDTILKPSNIKYKLYLFINSKSNFLSLGLGFLAYFTFKNKFNQGKLPSHLIPPPHTTLLLVLQRALLVHFSILSVLGHFPSATSPTQFPQSQLPQQQFPQPLTSPVTNFPNSNFPNNNFPNNNFPMQ